ncbi:MAG TPA: CotH kinase family protein [Kofleriaceae bacterium]|nr:CotH kinase family protein [Kofleriaceae bacterium]
MRSWLVLCLLAILACGHRQERRRATADHARAFPQDRVARIDITITPANWSAMRADLASMLGEAGSRPHPGPPPEAFTACDARASGDACIVSFGDHTMEGVCRDLRGRLACEPKDRPGGPGGPGRPGAPMGPPGRDGRGPRGPGPMGGGGPGKLLARTPVYVECTVEADGMRWEHVGVRFKGNSSLASSWGAGVEKLPLRLSFDHFDDRYPELDRQRFFGFRSLSLSNGWGDPSLVREKVAAEVFAEAGLPVPLTAFYRVYIDHGDGPQYAGVYVVREVPSDKAFLRRATGSDTGNLYKPEAPGGTFATFEATSLDQQRGKGDHADVRGLFDALHADRRDAAAWRAQLERWLDVEGFLRWLAINTVIQDWDTYGRMAHNYYLYGRPEHRGRLQWIPWDHSFAFDAHGMQGALSLGMDEVGDDWPLIRFLLDDPVYRAVYDREVAAAVTTVYEPARAGARFAAARALVEPYVVGEGGEQAGRTFTSAEAFASAHEELQGHPAARAEAVRAYLGRQRPAAGAGR